MRRRRAIFLDLNGTIVLPLKQESLDDLKLISGADIGVRRLMRAGFVCPVISVQSRIAKGVFTELELRAWFSHFFGSLNLDLKGPYICPHRYGQRCVCRKPNPFLYEQAAEDLSVDLNQSYVIGDSPEDVEAALRFGGLGCLVRTGWAADDEVVEQARSSAAFIGDTIIEAVDWILRRDQRN